MKALIELCVRRPVAVAMAYCGVALLAWAAWSNLPVDVAPDGRFPEMTVRTSWPGASPEAVQSLVTSRIEALVVTVPGVRKVSARSGRGSSLVTLQLEPDARFDLVRFEIADRLALLARELPPEASAPQLSQTLPRQFQDLQGGVFLGFTVRGPRPLDELRRLALERIQPALAGVDGVAEVTVLGGNDPHVRVTLEPERLRLYGLTATDVHAAIRRLDESLPVGAVQLGEVTYALRVDHRVGSLEQIRALPLRDSGGRLVRVGDVGTVAYGTPAPRQFVRVNGQPQVKVQVARKAGTDVLGVAHAVRARMARLRQELPADLVFEIQDDEAADLEAELALLGRRLVLVLLLVAGLLIALLRDARSAPLLLLSIGASLAITVVCLYHLGVPVNVLTLTGLALAFGMLVDNAVVVLENVIRHRHSGEPAERAARRGTAEVVLPLLAATLTTIGVFFPFVYFQGRMRATFMPLAVAIALALGASLLVSLTLMPAAAGRGWIGRSGLRGSGTIVGWFQGGLRLALRRPWLVVLVVAAAWYGSFRLFDEQVPRGEFLRFWGGGRDRLSVYLTLPSGAEASRTEETIRPFEQYALGLPEIARVELNVAGNQAFLFVKFPPAAARAAYPLLVKEELIAIATRYAGVHVAVSGFDDNFYASGLYRPGMLNSRIHLYGYDYEQLGRIGEEIARTALRSPRVREANVTAGSASLWGDPGAEVLLQIDRAAAARYGLTSAEVASRLSALLGGATRADELRVAGRRWDLLVKVAGAERRTLAELLDTGLITADGVPVRLRELVQAQVRRIPGEITRENQRYDRFVQWEYRGSVRAAARYRQAIFDALALPPGVSASLDDGFRLTEQEQVQIRKVALLALAIVGIWVSK